MIFRWKTKPKLILLSTNTKYPPCFPILDAMLTIFTNRSILSGMRFTRTTRVASALLVMVVTSEGSLGHSLVFLLFESNLKLKSKPKLVCNIYASQLSLTADQKLCHGSSPAACIGPAPNCNAFSCAECNMHPLLHQQFDAFFLPLSAALSFASHETFATYADHS